MVQFGRAWESCRVVVSENIMKNKVPETSNPNKSQSLKYIVSLSSQFRPIIPPQNDEPKL